MIYVLSDDDVATIKAAVNMRIEVSKNKGLNHATTYSRDMKTRIREEKVGAAAELAWARINRREWHSPINEFHDIPDDGVHEVRATDHPRGGLIIRDNDPLDRKYIFAKIDRRTVNFLGWAYGHEVKIDKYLWNPHGFRQAWRMPPGHLHKMSSIDQE